MITKAKLSDLDKIKDVYAVAREFMANNGNPTQWAGGYPNEKIITEDIKNGNLYKIVNQEEIVAVFAFIVGVDPTYKNIYDGHWVNEDEYGAIHRVASIGKEKGVVSRIVEYCKSICNNLRCDTHLDNKIMQRALEKCEFKRCGTIYVACNSPRIAYQYVKE